MALRGSGVIRHRLSVEGISSKELLRKRPVEALKLSLGLNGIRPFTE